MVSHFKGAVQRTLGYLYFAKQIFLVYLKWLYWTICQITAEKRFRHFAFL